MKGDHPLNLKAEDSCYQRQGSAGLRIRATDGGIGRVDDFYFLPVISSRGLVGWFQ